MCVQQANLRHYIIKNELTVGELFHVGGKKRFNTNIQDGAFDLSVLCKLWEKGESEVLPELSPCNGSHELIFEADCMVYGATQDGLEPQEKQQP